MAQRSRGRNNWWLADRGKVLRVSSVATAGGTALLKGTALLMSRSERTPAPADVIPNGIEAGVAFGFEITIDALAEGASAERLRTPDDALAAGFGGEGSRCEA
jgi:hypothetical protein